MSTLFIYVRDAKTEGDAKKFYGDIYDTVRHINQSIS